MSRSRGGGGGGGEGIRFSFDRLPGLQLPAEPAAPVFNRDFLSELIERRLQQPSAQLATPQRAAKANGALSQNGLAEYRRPAGNAGADESGSDGDEEPDVLSLHDGSSDEGVADPAVAANTVSPTTGSRQEEEFIALELDKVPRSSGNGGAAVAAAAVAVGSTDSIVPPWTRVPAGVSSQLLRLHNEIMALYCYLAPTPAEAAERSGAVERVQAAVSAIWPHARVEVFGSFATGLYLPTSDIDLVVMGSGVTAVPPALRTLAQALLRKGAAKNITVIAKAKVPIVKFDDVESGVSIDVSFEVANGPEAAQIAKHLMDSLPPMRPLMTLFKVFLQQRELNEVYSGGVGSYALMVMVATFLLTHPSRTATSLSPAGRRRGGGGNGGGGGRAEAGGRLEQSLGVLAVDFLRLYGRALNVAEVAISARKGGRFLPRRSTQFANDNEGRLAVEDPHDATNDLGRGSFAFFKVRQAFDHAYQLLVAPAPPTEPLLSRVIRLDPAMYCRDVGTSLQPPGARCPPAGRGDGAGAADAAADDVRGGKKKKKRRRECEQEREQQGREAGVGAGESERGEQGGAKAKQRRDQEEGEGEGGEHYGQEEAGGTPPSEKKKRRREREREREREGGEREGHGTGAPPGGRAKAKRRREHEQERSESGDGAGERGGRGKQGKGKQRKSSR